MRPLFKIVSSEEDIQMVLKMRFEIFTQEQGIPHELDIDGYDEKSFHVLVLDEKSGYPMASGRLTITGTNGVLSRIAVYKEYRGLSLGQKVVHQLEKIALSKQIKQLSLSPHSYLENFYTSLGYHTETGEKQVGKYTLLTMTKKLV